MRKVAAITWLHLKTLFTSPSVLVLMLVMPLLFSFIFGGMSGDGSTNKPVVMIVAEGDEASNQTVKLLTENKQYQWIKATEDSAKEKVNAQEAIAAVVIAENFAVQIENEQPLFEVINQRKTQAYTALYPFLEGVGNTVLDSYQLASDIDSSKFISLLSNISERKGVEIKQKMIQKEGGIGESTSLLTVGFTIMFMMFGISGAASTILDEKKGGTWQRLLTTPTSKGQIMAGYLLSYFLMGWFQMVVLMVAMTVLYGAVWGNLLYFIPFTSLIILTIVGFGLMMASLVKTSQQAGALNAVLIVSTCMLGGVYWPLEIVPEFMQQMAKGVPQSWMMEGLREIISGSLYTPSLVYAGFVLIGFCAVFFTIGLKKIKFH